MNEKLKELIDSAYCRHEYENGSVHESYEFSKDELILLIVLIVGAHESGRSSLL